MSDALPPPLLGWRRRAAVSLATLVALASAVVLLPLGLLAYLLVVGWAAGEGAETDIESIAIVIWGIIALAVACANLALGWRAAFRPTWGRLAWLLGSSLTIVTPVLLAVWVTSGLSAE